MVGFRGREPGNSSRFINASLSSCSKFAAFSSRFSTFRKVSRNLVAESWSLWFWATSFSWTRRNSSYSASLRLIVAVAVFIRDFNLSAWVFSRDRDSSRSVSTFTSATLSFRRLLIFSRALVYLRVVISLYYVILWRGGGSPTLLLRRYRQTFSWGQRALQEANTSLLGDKIWHFLVRLSKLPISEVSLHQSQHT